MIRPVLISLIQYALLLGAYSLSWHAWQWFNEWRFLRSLKILREITPNIMQALDAIQEMDEETELTVFEAFKKANPLFFLYRNPTGASVEVYTDLGWQALTENSEVEPKFYHNEPTFEEPEFTAVSTDEAKVGLVDDFFEMQETVIMLAKWRKSNEVKS